jgi:hypothetical protein
MKKKKAQKTLEKTMRAVDGMKSCDTCKEKFDMKESDLDAWTIIVNNDGSVYMFCPDHTDDAKEYL